MQLLPSLMCVCVFLLPIQRVTFKYDGSTIVPGEQGAEYQDFIQECTGRETRLLGGIPDLLGNCQRGGEELQRPNWEEPGYPGCLWRCRNQI